MKLSFWQVLDLFVLAMSWLLMSHFPLRGFKGTSLGRRCPSPDEGIV